MKLGIASRQNVIRVMETLESQKPGFIKFVSRRMRRELVPKASLGAIAEPQDIVWTTEDFFGVDENETVVDPNTGKTVNWYDGILDFAGKAVPAWFEYEKQKDWADIQLERAKRGQEPLITEGYGAPPMRIRFSTAPGAVPRAMGWDQDTINQILIGGAIIGGIFFLSK